MLVLHYLENSRAQRILWLLEELDLSYEIKKYERTSEERAPEGSTGIHPLGKFPILIDNDFTIAESGAIVEYVITKYAKDKPELSESQWLDNLFYTHYAEGTLQKHVIQRYLFSLVPQRFPMLIRPILRYLFTHLDTILVAPELERNGKLIEAHLEKTKTPWFAGAAVPTSADYMMIFTLETFILTSPEYCGEKTREWVMAVEERPAFQRALEKGGEYKFLCPRQKD